MRIISCASYYGTGSSAITDFVSEFDKCFSLSNYEFRFVQDPDGISDLEYNLVQNHNRHNSGHALKRYKKLVDFYAGNSLIKKYEQMFNNKWKEISYDYIDELTDFSYKGWWQYDLLDKGLFYYYRKLLLNKILHMTIWSEKDNKHINVLPKEITYCSRPSEERFLKCTRKYIDKLFIEANHENQPNIMVDQIVPPSNLDRFLRYFTDIKVFVVDRDPRDLYLLAKYIWKTRVIPTENEKVFCEWYKYTRAHRETEEYNKDKVMFINFEDIIYKYEETTLRIKEFLEFEERDHLFPKKYLDPLKSAKNTRLWETMTEQKAEVEYITMTLSQYIYNYERVGI